MKEKYLLATGALALAAPFQLMNAAEKAVQKPNVLVILIDDAGYADFGFNGSKEILTPNIDALSQQGVVLTDGHVAASVSSPSRAMLMTGRFGHRFGYECNLNSGKNGLPLTEQTMGDVFHENGYRTAAIGKWHLGKQPGMHPNDRGFDLFYGMLGGSREYFYNPKGSDKPGHERALQLNGKQVKFDGYFTDRLTDKAVEFIEADEKPFFMYLAYNAVHNPMQATEEDLARFKGHPRQKLAAMTWALDRGVGRVVESLKKSGKFDNTLIFFLSDNGGARTNTSSNLPLKGFKGNKFEGGHRVPFFVVYNGEIKGGQHFDGLSSSLDIFKTSLDAAGIQKTKHELDGISLLPYLKGEKQGDPHKVLYWRKMDTRAIREGDYKMILTRNVDTVLYNIREDIEEMHNLKDQEPKIYQRLAKKLEKWEKKECVDPLWIEEGWRETTNDFHRMLMQNEIKTSDDAKKISKKKK